MTNTQILCDVYIQFYDNLVTVERQEQHLKVHIKWPGILQSSTDFFVLQMKTVLQAFFYPHPPAPLHLYDNTVISHRVSLHLSVNMISGKVNVCVCLRP